MKLKFNDNEGNKDTIYFNPEVVLYRDGTTIILPTTGYQNGKEHDIPMYAGEGSEVWLDVPQGMYLRSPNGKSSPGTFKAIWVDGGIVNITRYKEKTDQSLFDKIIEVLWR
jgi:hypothetical protein